MVNPNRLLTPLPNQRKTRDKSTPPPLQLPETYTYHHHLTTRNTNNLYLTNTSSTSSLIETYNQSYGDSYEFGANSDSFSRAIDLSNSDPFRQTSSTNYVYYTVQPGDTLQNLSVKYSCPVASIKRLNNIWSDQEFYGLTKIKLPAGRLRLIAEVINEATNKTSSTETETHSVERTPWFDSSPEDFNNSSHSRCQDFRPVEENGPSKLSHQDYQFKDTGLGSSDSFFKNYDLNIERTRSAARCYDANAIMQSLAKSGNIVDNSGEEDDSSDPSKIARREAQNLLNDMSDYGLSYNGLILFIFIVCLICPLAYVIYLEETHHDSNKTL